MKIRLLVLAWLAVLLPALAESPDDQYVHIYNLIQEADAISRPTEALAKYLEAQSSLQRFQKAYPDWNTRVVKFRLDYLSGKVSAIANQPPEDVRKMGATTNTNPPSQKPTVPDATPATAAAAPSVDWQSQLHALQDQNRQLQADKVVLQAKLKEALSVQPPATDPRALATAQERINSLEKENQLLKVTLAQQKPSAASPQTNTVPQDTAPLAEANRKLAQQTELTRNLAIENKQLQTKLDQALASKGGGNASEATKKALADANARLAQQATLAKNLAVEKEALQARVKKLTADADAAVALRSENQLLKKQLADLKAAPSSSVAQKQTGDPGKKLALAEAQIAALQSDKELLRLEKIALENRLKQITSGSTVPNVAATTQPRTNILPQTPNSALVLASAPVPQTVQATNRTAPVSVPVSVGVAPGAGSVQVQDALRIKQLEAERDDLQKRLDTVLKQTAGRKPGKAASSAHVVELESQLAGLRARLQVFEAHEVPYTAEELALFKRPQPTLASATNNPARKPAQKLPPAAASLLAEAHSNFAARQFDKAEEKYRQVLRHDDKNVVTLANLAAIELEANHLQEAETHLKRALATAPDDSYSLSILGYLRYRQQKYDDAFDSLSRAAQLNPDNAEIQNFLGLTLTQKGMRGQAETALRKALQIDPNYGNAHNNLAVIYLTQQPPLVELARWHYQKALAAGHPHNAELERELDTKRTTAQSGQ